MLLEDAIQSLQNNDTSKALIRLNLADQQLGASPNPSKQITANATTFLKYENSTYGIKMQYPSDWRVEGATNSSPVAKFLPQDNNANKVMVLMSIQNLSTSLKPDEYLRSVMQRDVTNSKDFPDINFTFYTTSNVSLAGHPGFLLNGTFKDPDLRCIRRVR